MQLDARAQLEREFFDHYYETGVLAHTARPPFEVGPQGELMLHPEDWTRHGLDLLGDVRGMRVLDVGCGLGVHAVALAQRRASVLAIDVSPVAVRSTRNLAQRFNVEHQCDTSVASVYRLPLRDHSVDAVFGSLVLHHLAHREAGVEIARVLKPRGLAVFCENSAANPVLMWGRQHLVGRFGIHRYGKDQGEY